MNIEQEHRDFEAHFSKPPFEWEFRRYSEDSAWPGNYQQYNHRCAWEAWQAHAALQEQYREDAERLNKMFRAFGLKGLEDFPQWPCSFGQACEIEQMIENGYLRQTFDEWIAAIDHARRIEGEAK